MACLSFCLLLSKVLHQKGKFAIIDTWIGVDGLDFSCVLAAKIPFGVSAELCVLPAGKGWGKLIRIIIAWIKFHPLNLLPLGGTVLGIAQHLATTF